MLSRLKLIDFRCYGSFSWQISPAGSRYSGKQCPGKNQPAGGGLLPVAPAIPAYGAPRSPSGPRQAVLRHPGGTAGQIRRILWAPDAPDLQVNGEPRRDQRSYLADSYPVVWMGNDDLSLVRAGADARRKYMDFLGTQWHPGYRTALFSYRRALKTRNHLLKHKSRDRLQIDAYTRQLALYGTELRSLRASLLELLLPHIIMAYRPHRRQGGTGRGGLPGGGGRRPVRTDVRRAGPGHPVWPDPERPAPGRPGNHAQRQKRRPIRLGRAAADHSHFPEAGAVIPAYGRNGTHAHPPH